MRIFSGIQPTGRKHIGNYIGAIQGYLDGQERGAPAIYCIVDLHATGVAYDPAALPGYVLDTAAMLMAAGLDPGRCILFRQSDVREHSELCWLLSSVTSYGDLQRMHQFKDKSAREQELVRASLFLYPVLMAADILLYKTDQVPVGDDQRQHVELAREVVRRFNSTYGDVLVEPEHVIPSVGGRVMDLQEPGVKMSTTYGTEAGLIYIDDEPGDVIRKLKRAETDSGREIVRQRGQARDHQPDRDPRGRAGDRARPGRARLRGRGLRGVQAGRGGGRGRAAHPGSRALRRAAPGPGRPGAHACRGRRARPRDRVGHDGRGTPGDGNRAAGLNAFPCGADHKGMKVLLERPLVRPLLIVLAFALLWTLTTADVSIYL